MKRLIMMLLLVALAIPATAFAGINSSGAATCTATGFYRDDINLTAAQIGGNLTGDLDATGCDIGVYYGPGTKGSVKNATIENAKYFGVVNYRGKVNVTNSTISQIGNTPLDGTQHGVGIFYTTEETPGGTASGTAKGTIKGNILHSYQKGGITVRGAGASATIERNTLTGAGHVAYIAQNGIQVSSAAARRSRATPFPVTGTRRTAPRPAACSSTRRARSRRRRRRTPCSTTRWRCTSAPDSRARQLMAQEARSGGPRCARTQRSGSGLADQPSRKCG